MVPWDFSLENELHVTEEKVSDNIIYFCLAFLLIYGSAPYYIALQVACFVLKIRILSVLKFLFHLIKSIWFTLLFTLLWNLKKLQPQYACPFCISCPFCFK